ncbi:MAG: 30S ribosomal protein S2 [Candidatus Omnitrophica bacterium]|nr:30S ribosomal protein S2 [Candidatus Omnitrophota bacterium]
MTTELVKKLLEAGVHFGHQTRRWNPKMKKFIFGDRGGIYIIDLEKTADCLNLARDFARDKAAKGAKFLFVGTKKQAQEVMRDEAVRSGMFYVNSRWMGGLLTNFETVKKSIRKLQDIERMEKDGTFEKLTKKEVALLNKEKARLTNDLGGIREMTGAPDVMVVVDVKNEEIAVREAKRLNIPVIAMIDTNSDPDPIDYCIPANDDAVKSIRLIINYLTEGIIEGRRELSGDVAKPVVAPVVEVAQPVAEVPDVTDVVPAVIKESLAEELDVYDEVVERDKDTKKPVKPVKKVIAKEKERE